MTRTTTSDHVFIEIWDVSESEVLFRLGYVQHYDSRSLREVLQVACQLLRGQLGAYCLLGRASLRERHYRLSPSNPYTHDHALALLRLLLSLSHRVLVQVSTFMGVPDSIVLVRCAYTACIVCSESQFLLCKWGAWYYTIESTPRYQPLPSAKTKWTPHVKDCLWDRLEVPLDYSAVALSGSILFNPGGPGNSAVDFIKKLGKLFQEVLGSDDDINGLDPCGLSLVLVNYPHIDSNRRRGYWSYHSCRKYFWKRRTLSTMGYERPGFAPLESNHRYSAPCYRAGKALQ